VSRDAAHVILMKDDFAAIVKGVKEGRTIFDNITKTIGYTITHMLPEVSAVLMNLAFGYPLGLNAILILALDLGTELAPSVSLAYEVGESDVMDRAPRNAHSDRLVTGKLTSYFVLQAGLIETLFCMIGYFSVFAYHGISGKCLYLADGFFITDSPDFVCNGLTFNSTLQLNILAQAQSLYWVMIVFTQLFHIFICKARIASLFDHGFFQNHSMNTGASLSVSLSLCLSLFLSFFLARLFLSRLVSRPVSFIFSTFIDAPSSRRLSPLAGVTISVFIGMFVVYVPWTNSFFGTAGFPGWFWFLPLAPASLLFARMEIVKWLARSNKDGWIAHNINW
jgi:magnesium-transporting ATPase (P-type)